MKKPIVAVELPNGDYKWVLGGGYVLVMTPGGKYVTIKMDPGEYIGEIDRYHASDIFNVILYPPDSVPSPEPANPDININYEVRDKAFDEVIDIPRQDLPPK